MNGTWAKDSLPGTTAGDAQWAQCFANEVQTMRKVAGANFLFDWNVNANSRSNLSLASYYPGNLNVDLIGIDFYDQSSIALPPVGDPTRWGALAGEQLGLNALYVFAQQHGKPLSIPEWGTVTTQGDDPNYVTNIGSFVANHDVAYQSWFDAGDDSIYMLDYADHQGQAADPLSLSAYRASFSSG
jgi:beta-mannanase